MAPEFIEINGIRYEVTQRDGEYAAYVSTENGVCRVVLHDGRWWFCSDQRR